MLKLLGACLVTGGGLWAGLSAAGDLRRRAGALEAWRDALGLLESELRFTLPALPELMEALARCARAPAGETFDALAEELDRLGEKPFEELWDAALEAHPGALSAEDVDVLRRLGRVLGRYGGEDQCRAAQAVRMDLDRRALQVREELERKGKAYGTLGAGLGAFLTILLL